MQSWLEHNDAIMHSTFNESNSLVTEGFIELYKEIFSMKLSTDSQSYVSYLKS